MALRLSIRAEAACTASSREGSLEGPGGPMESRQTVTVSTSLDLRCRGGFSYVCLLQGPGHASPYFLPNTWAPTNGPRWWRLGLKVIKVLQDHSNISCPPAIPGLDAPVKKWSWVQSIARNTHGPTEVNLWSGFQWGYFCPLNCDTGFTWKEVPTLGWSRGRAGTGALGPVNVPCGSRKRDMYGFSKLWDQIHWFYLSRLGSEAKSISK